MSLGDRYSALLDKCVGSLTTWQNFIHENLEGRDKEIERAKLQEIVKEYCIIDINHDRSVKAITLLEEALTDASQTYNVDTIYAEKLSEQETGDPTDNEIWRQLFNNDLSIQEVKFKKRKDRAQYEEVDDSLLCSSAFTAPTDPITKLIIRKPVRNKKCKHVYDHSIYDYIRQSRNKAKCPYMGCKNNRLIPDDLQEDRQLEEQITQYLATQESQQSTDDDDDSD